VYDFTITQIRAATGTMYNNPRIIKDKKFKKLAFYIIHNVKIL